MEEPIETAPAPSLRQFNVKLADHVHDALVRRAGEVQAKTGETTTTSDLVRQAIAQMLDQPVAA